MSNPSYLHGWNCQCPHDRRTYKANRIAAVRGQNRTVPAVGAIRRVRALQAMGHRMTDLAMRTGLAHVTLRRLGQGEQEQVFLYLHERLAEVYAELENVQGDSNHNRARAARKGWVVPAAWDDIDDPKEKPKR